MKRNMFVASGAMFALVLGGLLSCGGDPAVTSAGAGGASGASAGGSGQAGGSGGASTGGPGAGGANGGGANGGANGGGANGGTGGTPSMGNNCGVQKVDLHAGPADLLLVLDRSHSMTQDVNGNGGGTFGGTMMPMGPSKWSEVVGALDPVIMQTQGKVSWGLKLFPLPTSCGVPDGATVPVALNNYMPVLTAIKGNDPATGEAGSTPTRVAIQKATAVMMANTSPNPKYLLLATDGLPNCAGDQTGGRRGGGGQASDAMGAIQSVADAATAGFPTFVVGIATSGTDADTTLNDMAVKGGRPRNDPTKYYPVASRDELVAALGMITGQIASCTFPLNPPPPVPNNVLVQVDGMKIAQDTTQMNGWNYGAGNRTIVLFGAACDSVKTGAAKNVQILYGCPGVIIK